MYSMGLSSPISRFPFFPCGAFQRKAPQNIFAGNPSSADGRAQRYCRAGSRLSFLVLFSFSGKKREHKKTSLICGNGNF